MPAPTASGSSDVAGRVSYPLEAAGSPELAVWNWSRLRQKNCLQRCVSFGEFRRSPADLGRVRSRRSCPNASRKVEPFCRARSNPLSLRAQPEAFFGALDHRLGGADFGLPDGAGGFDITSQLSQQRVLRPIVFGIAASHVPPRVCPGAAPEARDIGGQRYRPSRR